MSRFEGTTHTGLSSFFQFDRYKTTFNTEVVAGISIYLSLAYIFIVNPAILSKSGLNPSAVLFATVVVSALSTIAMGLWARLPFAVAPGLEMNGFFAFVVVGTLHMSWQQALGTVFFSGVLCLIFTTLRVRHNIISSIPLGLKKAIGASVGVFVATIGLFLSHILTFTGGRIDFTGLSFGVFNTHLAYVLYIGLFLAVVLGLPQFRFRGGMLISILIGAFCCYLWGIKADTPPQLSSDMFQAVGALDLSVIFQPNLWSPIMVFFVVDFLGGIGKFIGLTANTNIQDEHGNVPNLQRGLYVDGAGTIAGSLMGTSSLIAFVESAVGIEAGGRTGLTAVVCGFLMAGSLAFAPLLQWVPAEAAAGVLVYVGYLLLPKQPVAAGLPATAVFDISVAAVMGVLSLVTFSLDKAMALGFWAYFIKGLVTGGKKEEQAWLGGIATVLTFTILWQWWISLS
jgi:adenine/guanine/hypoxanthine permease